MSLTHGKKMRHEMKSRLLKKAMPSLDQYTKLAKVKKYNWPKSQFQAFQNGHTKQTGSLKVEIRTRSLDRDAYTTLDLHILSTEFLKLPEQS